MMSIQMAQIVEERDLQSVLASSHARIAFLELVSHCFASVLRLSFFFKEVRATGKRGTIGKRSVIPSSFYGKRWTDEYLQNMSSYILLCNQNFLTKICFWNPRIFWHNLRNKSLRSVWSSFPHCPLHRFLRKKKKRKKRTHPCRKLLSSFTSLWEFDKTR